MIHRLWKKEKGLPFGSPAFSKTTDRTHQHQCDLFSVMLLDFSRDFKVRSPGNPVCFIPNMYIPCWLIITGKIARLRITSDNETLLDF